MSLTSKGPPTNFQNCLAIYTVEPLVALATNSHCPCGVLGVV